MGQRHIENARIFKAFCDENRLMVLEMLQYGEKCACELLESLEISQPTLSHHMKILVDSGIVSARKNGKWMFYSFSAEGVAIAKKLLVKLTGIIKDCSNASDCYCEELEKKTGRKKYGKELVS